RTGIVPIAHSQDTAGPMTRSVADAAALLAAMAGSDPEDEATRDSATKRLRDYSSFLDRNGLKGARLGVVRDKLFGYNRAADELAEKAIADMRAQGAIIIDPANIPTLGKFDETEFTVMLYELKADLAKYLTWSGSTRVRTLADVIAFNDAHRAEEMPFYGQDTMVKANAKGPLTSPEYRRALENNHKLARAQGIDAVMAKYNLDALVAPTGTPAWLIDLVTGDHLNPDEVSPSTIAAVAGYPHITVPMGFYRGLPVGISFFGRAWSEPVLIKIAYAYEQATNHRQPPRFLPTINPAPSSRPIRLSD